MGTSKAVPTLLQPGLASWAPYCLSAYSSMLAVLGMQKDRATRAQHHRNITKSLALWRAVPPGRSVQAMA